MRLYKKRYKKTLKRYRMAKERGQKAEQQVAQLQESMNVESALNSKKLALERDLAYKKVVITDKIDSKTKQLNNKLAQKKLDHTAQLATERMMDQRKHYDKVLKKRDDKIDDLRRQIWVLNKKVQHEMLLRKATEQRARSAGAPHRLQEAAESPNNRNNSLEATFRAAEKDAGASAELHAQLEQGQSLVKFASQQNAKVQKSAFLVHSKVEKRESST